MLHSITACRHVQVIMCIPDTAHVTVSLTQLDKIKIAGQSGSIQQALQNVLSHYMFMCPSVVSELLSLKLAIRSTCWTPGFPVSA